eukprot:SM000213S06807  [mRNA]  locus=s213:84456:86608:+ [translate_table: standard]
MGAAAEPAAPAAVSASPSSAAAALSLAKDGSPTPSLVPFSAFHEWRFSYYVCRRLAHPSSQPARPDDGPLLSFPVHPPRQPGIEAWYMDDSAEDQRLEHRLSPNQPVSSNKLDDLGVLQWRLDADQWESDPKLAAIREERGYSYHDVIAVAPDKLPNYEEKIKGFFEEHLHTDEEIRYVLEGSGYFDVRDTDEQWIRIKCCKGDMIVLPAGIYHRFTLDSNDYIKALRLFVGEPVWTPHNRPADHLDARQVRLLQSYMAGLAKAQTVSIT